MLKCAIIVLISLLACASSAHAQAVTQGTIPWKVSFDAVAQPVTAAQSGTWTVRFQDGSGNALASSTTDPVGTEQALIVRNLPSGTQYVAGAVGISEITVGGESLVAPDSSPTGTEFGLVVRNIPSGTQPVSGAVTVSGTVAATQSGTWNIDNLYLPLIASFTSSALSYEGDPDTGIGVMPLGLVASGAPSYSNGNMAPIRLDTAGAQVVSGTLYAAQTGVWSLAANQSVNIAQMNGVTTTMGNGASGTGVQRVTIADDSTGLVKLATGANTIGALTANQSVNTAQFGGTNVSTGTGAGGAGIPRVTISNDSSLAANQSVNVAQMNGVTTSMGVGASGTGTLRVAALIHDGTDTALVTTAGALNADVSSIAGTATAVNNGSASAGVQRVTIASDSTGNIATIGTSVTPGTAAGNLGKAEDATAASGDTGVAWLAQRKDTNSTLTSADAEYVVPAADNYGVLSVSGRHPNAVRCTITSTATSSTVVTGCAAPGAGLSIYITGLTWSSSIISTTANFMRVQAGTGGTCGTGTTVLFDGYASVAFGGQSVTFPTPIKVTANNEVCFVHASAGTRLVNIVGFIAP